MIAVSLGFTAGSLFAIGAAELAFVTAQPAMARMSAALRTLTGLIGILIAVGHDGRDPGVLERRRLLGAGAIGAFLIGWMAVGPLVGLGFGLAGPWTVGRILRLRRDHYRRAVDSDAAELAAAIADALAAGHSVRGAIGDASRGLGGPAGHELRRAAAELAAGSPTVVALEGLRDRTGSPRIAAVVAACLIQADTGGNLSRLLREHARSFADQTRLEHDVRAATAQARFTGVVVVLLPLGGAILAELASPGFLGGLMASWLTAWLVGFALAMQIVAAVVIHRLGRVRW